MQRHPNRLSHRYIKRTVIIYSITHTSRIPSNFEKTYLNKPV